MPITYLKNGQPFEACWRCHGSGQQTFRETDDFGRACFSSCECSGCNGTGNELFMVEPDPTKAENLEG